MKKETQNQEEMYDVESIKKYMEENNLTLKQFAEKAGISLYIAKKIVNQQLIKSYRPAVAICKLIKISANHFMLLDKNRDYIPRK